MKHDYSRRDFLAAGLALPAAGLVTSSDSSFAQGVSQTKPESARLDHRILGKTGLKVTSLAFGCMTTSDPSVIEHAADFGINLFDTARSLSGREQRADGRRGSQKGADEGYHLQQKPGEDETRSSRRPRYKPSRTGYRLSGYLVSAYEEPAAGGERRLAGSATPCQTKREDPLCRRQYPFQHGPDAGATLQRSARRMWC